MGKKVKVVFDTNVWVSIAFDKTLAKEILPLIDNEDVIVYTSRPLTTELARVLTYPKVLRLLEEVGESPALALTSILRMVKFVRTRKRVAVITEDHADNRVLECALAAKVDFVVSGDKHLLNLRRFDGMVILRPRNFVIQIRRPS